MGSLFIILGLLLVSAMFAGVEAGLLSVNRARLRTQVDRGDPSAAILNQLLARPGELLTVVLLVTNLANIVALALITRHAATLLGWSGYLVALLVAMPIFVFGVEVLPKSLFRRFPYRALAFFARFLWLSRLLLSPLLWALSQAGIFRDTGSARSVFVARQEMKFATKEGERLGTLSEDERRLIHSVIDFRAVRLSDVMVPFEEVTYVKSGTTVEAAIRLGMEHDLDRLPVLGEDGQFVGLVNVLDLFFDKQPGTTVNQYLRRIVKVAQDESAFHVVRRLRAARLTLAAVVDEADRPIGIVGSENVMDRLVRAVVNEAA